MSATQNSMFPCNLVDKTIHSKNLVKYQAQTMNHAPITMQENATVFGQEFFEHQ